MRLGDLGDKLKGAIDTVQDKVDNVVHSDKAGNLKSQAQNVAGVAADGLVRHPAIGRNRQRRALPHRVVEDAVNPRRLGSALDNEVVVALRSRGGGEEHAQQRPEQRNRPNRLHYGD